jgi:hypothetical protein
MFEGKEEEERCSSQGSKEKMKLCETTAIQEVGT